MGGALQALQWARQWPQHLICLAGLSACRHRSRSLVLLPAPPHLPALHPPPRLPQQVVTTIEPAEDYYLAEKYHQQYLAKGGRGGRAQDASKGAAEKIRCYG